MVGNRDRSWRSRLGAPGEPLRFHSRYLLNGPARAVVFGGKIPEGGPNFVPAFWEESCWPKLCVGGLGSEPDRVVVGYEDEEWTVVKSSLETGSDPGNASLLTWATLLPSYYNDRIP